MVLPNILLKKVVFRSFHYDHLTIYHGKNKQFGKSHYAFKKVSNRLYKTIDYDVIQIIRSLLNCYLSNKQDWCEFTANMRDRSDEFNQSNRAGRLSC